MKFVKRAEWGARSPNATTALHAPRGVTIHWVGPGTGPFTHDRCAAKVGAIQDFHMDSRGWADIAYTAMVCPHGYVFEGRSVGVRTAANGTDAGNAEWYAVCALVGQGDPTPPALLSGLNDAIAWLRACGAGPAVNGHRDHKMTACPGDHLYAWAHDPHGVTPQPPGEDDMFTDNDREDLQKVKEALGRLEGSDHKVNVGGLVARTPLTDLAADPPRTVTLGYLLEQTRKHATAGLAQDAQLLRAVRDAAAAGGTPDQIAARTIALLTERLTK